MDSEPTQSTFTNLTLLGRVRDLSDQQAWNDFVSRYAPRIFAWCKQNSLQDQDASDVTQEVLLKLVTAMQQFEYEPARGSFRGWLKTITTNVVRDLHRKKSSSEVTGGSAEPWLDRLTTTDTVNSLVDQIEASYREELLEEAMSRVQLRVHEHTWEAYRLLTEEGQTASETASRLNLKVADVYVAKSRVLKLLKATVAELEGSEQW